MDVTIMKRVEAVESELSALKKMLSKNVDKEREERGKTAIKDLLKLSKHPKIKNWKEQSVAEIRISRRHE